MVNREFLQRRRRVGRIRDRSKYRFWLVIGIVFVVLWLARVIFSTMTGQPTWKVDACAIAMAMCTFFLLIDRQVNAFLCTSCGKSVPQDLVWICGYCNSRIRGIGTYHFFRCERQDCKRDAPGYQCHHCGQTIWFVDGHFGHCAHAYIEPLPGETPEETHARQIAELERELELRSLRNKVVAVELSTPKPKPQKQTHIERVIEEILSQAVAPIETWKQLMDHPRITALSPNERQEALDLAKKLLDPQEFRYPVERVDDE